MLCKRITVAFATWGHSSQVKQWCRSVLLWLLVRFERGSNSPNVVISTQQYTWCRQVLNKRTKHESRPLWTLLNHCSWKVELSSEHIAHSVGASTPGVCRADRRWFESRSTRHFLSVPSTASVRSLVLYISPPYRMLAHEDGQIKARKTSQFWFKTVGEYLNSIQWSIPEEVEEFENLDELNENNRVGTLRNREFSKPPSLIDPRW